MRPWHRSLRFRLVLSHVVVVIVGAVTLLGASARLAPTFFSRHLRAMAPMMGMGGTTAMDDLEREILRAFRQALWLAVVLSVAAALIVAAFAARRVLHPLEAIRVAARRLAGGSYEQRVPVPEETELAALAEDVNRLASVLEETEQRRMRLIGDVAHELRSPSSTIKGYMEGLLDGVFPADEEVFAATAREAARLERLAGDLAALSRASEGRLDLRIRPMDLREVASETAERLRPQFDGEGVTLAVLDGPSLPVAADPDRMAQVFTNILGNALVYTPPGGRVEVRPSRDRATASVAVVDEGPGLRPDQLEAVFERFYRADRTRAGGTGVGLTISRAIARLHDGDVTAASDGPGTGTTFVVSLPLRVPDSSSPSSPAA